MPLISQTQNLLPPDTKSFRAWQGAPSVGLTSILAAPVNVVRNN
jgi:hypothetical protein